jgi:hypothetical protein
VAEQKTWSCESPSLLRCKSLESSSRPFFVSAFSLVAAVLVFHSLVLACRGKYEEGITYEVPSSLLIVSNTEVPFLLSRYISPLLISVCQSHHYRTAFPPSPPLVGEISPNNCRSWTNLKHIIGGCQQYQDVHSHTLDHNPAYWNLAIGTLTTKARVAPYCRRPSILSPVGWFGALSMQPRSRLLRYRSSNFKTTELVIWN